MKKLLIFLSFMGLVAFSSLNAQNNEGTQTVDQTEQVAITSESENGVTKEDSNFFTKLISAVITFVVILLIAMVPIGMIGHMIYVNWQTRMLKKPLTLEHFVAKRTKKGLSETMTKEEIEQGFQLLDDAYNGLSVSENNEEGNEIRKPGKMKELLRAQKKVEEVGKLMPTDQELLDKYNDYRDFLYDYLRRSFFASWKLIILCLIVAVGIALITKGDTGGSFLKSFFTYGAFFWVPALVYYISSQVPQYMIDRKNERGGGKGWFSAALIGMGIGILGSGQTVRTKWSDGSVTEDNSGHVIALIIGLFVLLAVALTIYIWAIINYLRNYVIYW